MGSFEYERRHLQILKNRSETLLTSRSVLIPWESNKSEIISISVLAGAHSRHPVMQALLHLAANYNIITRLESDSGVVWQRGSERVSADSSKLASYQELSELKFSQNHSFRLQFQNICIHSSSRINSSSQVDNMKWKKWKRELFTLENCFVAVCRRKERIIPIFSFAFPLKKIDL